MSDQKWLISYYWLKNVNSLQTFPINLLEIKKTCTDCSKLVLVVFEKDNILIGIYDIQNRIRTSIFVLLLPQTPVKNNSQV